MEKEQNKSMKEKKKSMEKEIYGKQNKVHL